MRHIDASNIPLGEPPAISSSSLDPSNLVQMLAVMRRRKLLLILGAILGLSLGAVYYLNAVPKFTATTYILVSTDAPASGDAQPGGNHAAVDTAEVDSQVAVIGSDQVIKSMAQSLAPDARKQLAADIRSAGPTTKSGHAVSSAAATGEAGDVDIDPDVVRRLLTVTRVERTYVLAINYTATDPVLAADVANGFADAYQTLLRDHRLANAQRKVSWFEQRIDEARTMSAEADRVLQNFRLSPVVGESDVARRQLEMKADNFRKVYQSFLQRQQQAIDEETFPQDNLRIITPATPPLTRTSPKLSFVIAIALLVGVGGGAAAGAIREIVDHSFRTGGQVEDVLHARFLGSLPLIRKSQSRFVDDTADHVLPAVMRYATDNIHSRYAETLRSIRAGLGASSTRDGSKVIGIVSVLPGEGKSTVSVNLGRFLAFEGARVLVIDGDMRRCGLTRVLAPAADYGLYEVLNDSSLQQGLARAMVLDPTSGMKFLPILRPTSGSSGRHHQTSSRLEGLLSEARRSFDFIIIDLPPLLAVADARPMSALSDYFVLVVEWGLTSKGAVWKLLATERLIRDRLLGVVLNKVNLRKLKLYEHGSDPQHHRFREYFSDPAARSRRVALTNGDVA